jgi:hypothetical protein
VDPTGLIASIKGTYSMDQVYRTVYEGLFRGPDIEVSFYEYQSRRLPLAASRRNIRDWIESAEKRLRSDTPQRVSCRPDAKLLLLVNFLNLIALPIQFAERRLELREAVEHDIMLLMTAAKADDNGEISAHAIVDALSQNWRRLRVSDFKIWD